MACKWCYEFWYICCNGDSEYRADVCPYERQEGCKHYEEGDDNG